MFDSLMPDGRVVKTESAASRWLYTSLDWGEKSAEQRVLTVMKVLMGIFAIAASLNGFLYKKIHPVLRIVLAVGGLGMMIPGTLTDVVGLVLVAAVVAYQKISAKKHGGPVVTA